MSGLRAQSACSRASSARSVRSEADTRQPTTNREYASITNATYAKPDQVGNIGYVGQPQTVRTLRFEDAVYQIGRSGSILVWDGRASLFAPDHPFRAFLAHQPLYSATSHRNAFTVQLAPHLAGSVHPEVGLPNTADMGAQFAIPLASG